MFKLEHLEIFKTPDRKPSEICNLYNIEKNQNFSKLSKDNPQNMPLVSYWKKIKTPDKKKLSEKNGWSGSNSKSLTST